MTPMKYNSEVHYFVCQLKKLIFKKKICYLQQNKIYNGYVGMKCRTILKRVGRA